MHAESGRTSTWGGGMPAAAPDVFGIEWNAENQLIRVLKNGVEQARYAYDPTGRRVETVVGAATTAFLYDGAGILKETGTATTTYIQGPGIDQPLAREDGAGNRTYYHADGLGTLVKETNSAGTVNLTRKYDAFGNLQLGTDSGYAFTGREWDSEAGLYYYRARYYDPKIGRFISEDPMGVDADDSNYYAYVDNQPTGMTDPYGLYKFPIAPPPVSAPVMTGAGAAAAGVTAGVGVIVITLVYEHEMSAAMGLAEQEAAAAAGNAQATGGARSIPEPCKPRRGCTCTCRADADDTMPGNIRPGIPRFAFGTASAANCPEAAKEAKRIAIHALRMKPKHVGCRCAGR